MSYEEPGFQVGLEGFYRVKEENIIAKYEVRFYEGMSASEIMERAVKDGLRGSPKIIIG